MTNQLLSQLSKWIDECVGFYFPEKRWRDLERIANNVSKELGFEDTESCIEMLISTPLTNDQTNILIKHLTVGETYFYREKRSLDIFEKILLPELIHSCRAKGSLKFTIWSAGCSTGEEPYSIAIILRKTMADLDNWDITVKGTDINEMSLQKASNGIYSEWSFRDIQQGFKERYFKKTIDNKFKIQDNIKKMVTFSSLNLVSDYHNPERKTSALLPPANCQRPKDVDVIFCRNVLIYLSADQITTVINNLYDSLAEGGYLIVSPSEISNIFNHKFTSVNFSGATFYKKDSKKLNVQLPVRNNLSLAGTEEQFIHNTPPFPLPPMEADPKPNKTCNVSPTPVDNKKDEPRTETKQPDVPEKPEVKTTGDLYVAALDLFKQGRYDESIKLLLDIVANKHNDIKAIILLAQSYANKGEPDQALEWSNKAISIDKMNPACHYLNATILQEQGRTVEVANALKRAIYLNNDFILAHFMIGNIFSQQGKQKQSDKHFKNALLLLSACEPGDILPYSEGMTAGRLTETIRSMKNIKMVNA
ncbi:MAG: CheR family methyltransferase [Candidatus Anammoxibacter sp.]